MTISPEQHLGWILERIPRLPTERTPLAGASGRTLAEDVPSPLPLPLWDNSAMDGYAVRSADLAGASGEHPVSLRLVGEVFAGSPADPAIAPGEAVRIMTGAPVPGDADAVVAVEQTAGELGPGRWADRAVGVFEAVAAGRHIRRRGEDVERGTVLARAGEPLTALRLSALAAAGIEHVTVSRQPSVALVISGAELLPAGAEISHGQIPESNSTLIRGLLADTGITVTTLHRSADDEEALAAALDRLTKAHDVVITTGGIGPGVRDVTRLALQREPGIRGAQVAVRPGRPQRAGPSRGGAFVFALPGNPVSAAVSFELFVRPALLAMQGRTGLQRLRTTARAARGWRGVADRLQVLPVALANDGDELLCAPVVDPRSVSHAVGGQGMGQGYALIAAGRGDVHAGESVPVIVLDG